MAVQAIESKATAEQLEAARIVNEDSVGVTLAAALRGDSYNSFRRRIAAGEIPVFEVAGQTRVWRVDTEPMA